MKPFKFIRYFLVNSGVMYDYFHQQEGVILQNFLLEYQRQYGAYTFILGKNSMQAIYLNEYDINRHITEINKHPVYKKHTETTYLGQSFLVHRINVSGTTNENSYKYLFEQFNLSGNTLAKLQFIANQMSTEDYTFNVQYLISNNQVCLILACKDIIADSKPMFESSPELVELPSSLMYDVLTQKGIGNIQDHIVKKQEESDPKNDWCLVSIIDSLKEELSAGKEWPKYRVAEQENKIETLLSICRRLGLPT
jgi:hypothetical protein